MSQPRDYYEVLGVSKDVDDAALKKAYRKLALQYHPDRNPDNPEAEDKFKEASEAFQVLSDPQKRQIYDRFGHQGLKGQGGGAGFQDADEVFSQFADMFGDLFGGFGGGGRRGGGRRGGGRRVRRGADLQYALELDFMDAVHGTSKEIEIPRHTSCDRCDGDGVEPGTEPETCPTCNGAGEVIQQQLFLHIRTTCPTCRGSGKIIKTPCTKCDGAGRVRKSSKLTVTVPAGVDTGLQLRLSGKGDEGDPGAPSGDLYVVLQVKEHEFFRRDGQDVICTVPISYPQACLGGEISVPTVDENETVKIPAGTPSGKVITLHGKGVKNLGGRRGRGDQHIQVVVSVPKRMSAEEEELVRNLATLQEGRVDDETPFKKFWKNLTS